MGHPLQEAATAAAASSAACIVSNPIDVVRVRMQLPRAVPHPTPLHAFVNILRLEGGAALTRGLMPSFGYNILLNSVRFSLFSAFSAQSSKPEGPANFISGMLAGGIAGYIAAPLAQARTILQSNVEQETSRRIASVLHAWRNHPFAGASSWSLRNCGHTGIIFSIYENNRRHLEGVFSSNLLVSLMASLQASVVSVVVMNPIDLVSTRLFHRASLPVVDQGCVQSSSSAVNIVHSQRTHLSPMQCLADTIKTEGFSSLYSGLSANLLRIVPHTVITFCLMETLRYHATI